MEFTEWWPLVASWSFDTDAVSHLCIMIKKSIDTFIGIGNLIRQKTGIRTQKYYKLWKSITAVNIFLQN